MPKSRNRLNRKQIRNSERRAVEIQAFQAAVQVRKMAEMLPDQASLETLLLQEGNEAKRQAMFDFMRPYFKFANPHMPSRIIHPGALIIPGKVN